VFLPCLHDRWPEFGNLICVVSDHSSHPCPTLRLRGAALFAASLSKRLLGKAAFIRV
jgi:hypothetical protein